MGFYVIALSSNESHMRHELRHTIAYVSKGLDFETCFYERIRLSNSLQPDLLSNR